ncbi:MAG TPA: hypothetical protein VFJ58_01890 [Armatimonadota bacterium]|nr:hypothetical protein [Armatimonadota bacterium]
MPPKKLSPEQWGEYLKLYEDVSAELQKKPWFEEDWQTRKNYLNKSNPSGAWMQLIRDNWFDGNIHIETWLRNSNLDEQRFPLVLHIETSIPKHGLSRNDFTRVFLERARGIVESWDGYVIKPDYAMEPISARVPFTKETLVPALVGELERFQTLGTLIDQTIKEVKRP